MEKRKVKSWIRILDALTRYNIFFSNYWVGILKSKAHLEMGGSFRITPTRGQLSFHINTSLVVIFVILLLHIEEEHTPYF